MDESHPNFKILESDKYWKDLSSSAENVAEAYYRKQNINADVKVCCIGNPEGYIIYYSIEGLFPMEYFFLQGEIKDIIIKHVNLGYHEMIWPPPD